MCIWVKILNPQNESTSMNYWKLKLKATKFGWFLGTTIRTIFYLGPICSGHWLPVTSPHPDPCPTSSASLLLSSSSRAINACRNCSFPLQNHRNWCKKRRPQSVKKNTKNMFCGTLVKYCDLHLHSLAVRTEMRPCTGCRSHFNCVFRC